MKGISMDYQMVVKTNEDGTATATVGEYVKTFPSLYLAVEWAQNKLYELGVVDDG